MPCSVRADYGFMALCLTCPMWTCLDARMHTRPINTETCRYCGCWSHGQMVTAFTHFMHSPVVMHKACAESWRPLGLSYVVRRNVMGGYNASVRRNGRTTLVISYTRRRDAVRAILRGSAQRQELRYGAH
jgi:hypothetical protein